MPDEEFNAREASLVEREQELGRREAELRAQDPAEQEARIASRLAELEAAELQFVKTHAELAARSERLAEREQELTARERALPGGNGTDTHDRISPVDIEAIEARLRRLEQSGGGGRSFSEACAHSSNAGSARAASRTRLYTETPRGALAQLGERRLCKPEVAGSIPARSTRRLRALCPSCDATSSGLTPWGHHALGASADAWNARSRFRGQRPAVKVTTAQPKTAQAHVWRSPPAADAGASRQEIAHPPAAIDALTAGMRQPMVRRPESSTSSGTSSASAVITDQ